MTGEDFRYVTETIEFEGFEYAFLHYSDFEHIEDEEFHKLRKQFIKAAEDLKKFLGED